MQYLINLIKSIGILNFIGNLASIFGLIITIVILINIKNIKKYYFSKIRIPQLNEALKNLSSNLRELGTNYPKSENDLKINLGRITVIVESLQKKVPREMRTIIKELLEKINKTEKRINQEKVGSLYIDIEKFLLKLEEHENDLEWEIK